MSQGNICIPAMPNPGKEVIGWLPFVPGSLPEPERVLILGIGLSLFVRAMKPKFASLQPPHSSVFLPVNSFHVNCLPSPCIQTRTNRLLTFSTHSTHQNYSWGRLSYTELR